VAPNKFVAKIASDLKKPDGLVVVRVDEVAAFLGDLSVASLWGVGTKTASILQALGITTIGELARWPEDALWRRLGALGGHIHRLSRGIDDRPVIGEATAKSMGAETTFSIDCEDAGHIRQTLLRLAERVSARLRGEGCAGATITLKLRFADFTTLTRSCTVREPIALTEQIYAHTLTLLQKVSLRRQKVRLLGIAVSKLTAKTAPGQIPLFPSDPRTEKAAAAVDEIRRRFGETGVVRASLLPPRSRGTKR
jgi:DNA polymerase-4